MSMHAAEAVYHSPYPDLEIPKCNILSYLFPENETLSNEPLWIDAANPADSLSAKQALSYVKRLVGGLNRRAIGQQEAIMVFTPNHIWVPIVYLAAVASRRYYTGANPAYTTDELAFQITKCTPAALLVHPELLTRALDAAKKASFDQSNIFLFSKLHSKPVSGVQCWSTLLVPEEDATSWQWDPLGDEACHQVATINFSSGTTGLPKGVCNTHYNLVANTEQSIHVMFQSTNRPDKTLLDPAREKWLATLPLYHAFSQLYSINIACRLRIPIYVMEKFSLSGFFKNIHTFGITTVQTVPPALAMVAKCPRSELRKYDLSTLQNIGVGAAPMSLAIEAAIIERLGVSVHRGWGMTETTCVGIKMPPNRTDQEGSIGYLVPNTEAKIMDDAGHEIRDGPGELFLRGPQIMPGYWKDVLATQNTLTPTGWLKTGDIVVAKDHKWWIVDRKKELIKVNGLQVAPAELEAVLLQHHRVADAAVVGIQINLDDERPRAYVVLHRRVDETAPDKEEILHFVNERVSKHKRLTGGLKTVDAVPRLLSGKIKRSVVREWARGDKKSLQEREDPKL